MLRRKVKRRTLSKIDRVIMPNELIELIKSRRGLWRRRVLERHWYSRERLDFYWIRDTSLVAMTYLSASRISEVLRIRRDMVVEYPDRYVIQGVLLSKRILEDVYDEKGRLVRRKSKTLYREIWLPKKGERKVLTDMVIRWLEICPSERLYPFSRQRAWDIINVLTGYPPHWWRAFGESYLYEKWNFDLMAVADYVKVDPTVLREYLKGRYKRYPAI